MKRIAKFFLVVVVIAMLFLPCAGLAAPQGTGATKPAAAKGGKGLFLIDFDYDTGRVIAVSVLQSTGSAQLDATTGKTFKKWRCKPHTYRRIKVPLTYTIEGAK
jgi:TonB family protein